MTIVKNSNFDSQSPNFAQDHWALWAGLMGFFALQLHTGDSRAISWLCFCMLLVLSTWLLHNISAFQNRLYIASFVLIPMASCLHLQTFGSSEPEPGLKSALFTLSDLRSSPKGQIWLSGLLQLQSPEGKASGKKMRISFGIERKGVELSMGRWMVFGKLAKRPFSPIWQFVCSDKKWMPLPTNFSKISARWALWRLRAKAKISDHLISALPPTRARAFITGLLTGQQPDRRLGHLLSRVGLAHLMAVSGFHFACILAFGGAILRMLRLRHSAHLLFPLLLYFIYMGPSASVFRAAVMALYRIISKWRNKSYRPLQGLGFALVFWCLLWPDCSSELGFLLSYLCTGALLLLAQPLELLLITLWPLLKRQNNSSRTDRVRAFVRAALSANLSAHIATLVPQFYFWHFFPLASLIYNLLYPSLIGLFMPLLMIALGFCFICPLFGHALLRMAHALLIPLLRLTDTEKPWESLIWAECNLWTAGWVTAALMLFGLIWHKSHHRSGGELEKWIS